MLLVATDPDAEPSRAEQDDIEAWVDEMSGRGVLITGDRLRPPEFAKTARVRGDEASRCARLAGGTAPIDRINNGRGQYT